MSSLYDLAEALSATELAEELDALTEAEIISVLEDFEDMRHTEQYLMHEGAIEYARRIGKGNLASYVRALHASSR